MKRPFPSQRQDKTETVQATIVLYPHHSPILSPADALKWVSNLNALAKQHAAPFTRLELVKATGRACVTRVLAANIWTFLHIRRWPSQAEPVNY